ncbi:MAG: NDP-sugar synthase [Candidatus Aenigmarchaeota archaeon]|nr:NDP-sugar synthase [Candidatus Aenigmarchaeota archaeon]
MQVLILCGGVGKRLKPFTDETPKPLLEVLGKSVIEYQLDFFKRHGIDDIILCTGYKHELFEKRYPKLKQSVEKKPLGTAGAIKNAEKFIEGDFIVTNGDNIFSFNFQKLLQMFQNTKNPIIVLTQPVSPYGVIEVEGDRVINFREKPVLNFWVNAGITIFTKESLKYFPEEGMIEYDVYPKLVRDKKLFAFKLREGSYWLAIDTAKDIENAEKLLLQRK